MATPKVLLVLATLPILCHSHPQCLDTLPPFNPTDNPCNLLFCEEYQSIGCCTAEKSYKVLEKYFLVALQVMPGVSRPDCRQMLRELICTECNPYAAHVFQFEETGTPAPLPSMCTSYCMEFYEKCKEAVPLLTNDSAVLASLSSAQEFCDANAAADEIYCYPDVNSNDDLNDQLNNIDDNDGCLCVEEIASGQPNTVGIVNANDGSGRLFLVQQRGIIQVMESNGNILSTPFLDIRSTVLVSDSSGDERGLLSLAFHPNYKSNGRFFIYFMVRSGGDKTRLEEVHVSSDPNVADSSTRQSLLQLDQPYSNHNGGTILFGYDGFLYLSTGDGGLAGDPENRAQNLNSLLGKVLRIDVDMSNPNGNPYSIPDSNPFPDKEIYAFGLRNPWRCSIDRGDPVTEDGKGRIFCGDVGQNTMEEIDIIESGKNYGWRFYEGHNCYLSCTDLPDAEHEPPVFSYGRDVGRSVTGGYMYRGCLHPNIRGNYYFADFETGAMMRLDERNGGEFTSATVSMCRSLCTGNLRNTYSQGIATFGEDEQGELYFSGWGASRPISSRGASIYRLVDPTSNATGDC